MLIRKLIEALIKNRSLTVALAAIVVFVTVYLLISPASALEKEQAEEMGGIDVPAAEMSDEAASEDATEEVEPEQGSDFTFTGDGFEVSVNDDAGVLPEDTELNIDAIEPDNDEYADYYDRTIEALREKDGFENIKWLNFAKFYDITLILNDEEIEPDDPVDVKIAYNIEDTDSKKNSETDPPQICSKENVYIVHFTEDEKTGEATTEVLDEKNVELSVSKDVLDEASFKADSFSVYAVVEAPDPAELELQTVKNINEFLAAVENNAFRLSVHRNGEEDFFTNILNGNSAFNVTTSVSVAADWRFEPVEGQTGRYYISTTVDGETKYLNNPENNNVGLVDSTDTASRFEVALAADGLFYIKLSGQNKWLQYSNGGKGIRLYTSNTDVNNTRITFTYSSSTELEKDPYGLDGKKYGIAYQNGEMSAAGLDSGDKTVGTAQRLTAMDLDVKPDVLERDGVLLVAEGQDLVEWTFHSIEQDKYYITAEVDGQTKYLTIEGANVTLQDEPSEGSVISVAPGTGNNKGTYQFINGNYALNLVNGKASDGFNASSSNPATSRLHLVEKAPIEDDEIIQYTAKKVSISDLDKVYDGQQVVMYTRIWNDSKKKYEFFVVDYDHKNSSLTLVPALDGGDTILWTGSNVNTALWDFTEYTDASTGEPNYYYELQNTQYKDYIAPQEDGDQVLARNKIGINLNGRRYGEPYTTIIAWDDKHYEYIGLKTTDDGKIVPCSLYDAEDFYFAIIDENHSGGDDDLSEVTTVDNDQYGITMRMLDFDNAQSQNPNRDTVQNGFFGGSSTEGKAGLLSTNLGPDGYPVTTSVTGEDCEGHSLIELYDQDKLSPVNHLFLQSIYNESGYFEYNSTQNFAHLEENGDFTVYDQIAAIGTLTSKTRTHGQFMPYNDIVEGQYAEGVTNLTDVLGNELPDTDPRKGEQLYLIPQNDADYFFGMEMEASFTQTADGLDAWGHDIIFDFSGDDDFWLYVDGELVLDIGGVHAASVGTVNFRTGEVSIVMRTAKGDPDPGRTNTNLTLYEIFRSNYEARGMSEDQIEAKLDEIFETKTVDGKECHVFKDYSKHDMKIFYMERGAGASNLHMRFNLASVKPGTFQLSKKLSGTDQTNYDLAEFAYQVYYTLKEDGGNTPHLLGTEAGDSDRATYKGSTRKIRYEETFTPAGGTVPYEHVFILKPGETAEFDMPEDVADYWVVECGINPDVYDPVKINGESPAQTITTTNKAGGTSRLDFLSSPDNLTDRPTVEYDNHVKEGAMRSLTITKALYASNGTDRVYYPDDDTPFTFRLYLGNENASAATLPLADMYHYCVRDKNGYYCRWDADEQQFTSVGKTNYGSLTDAEKRACTFSTSMYGSISKIPADHKIEVRDLIIGTQFKVEERGYEIPKGYTLRQSDGYTRLDEDHEYQGNQPIQDKIVVDNDPDIEIRNQIGWGLTIEKTWTDQDFMQSHDPAYFAVYLDGQLLDDTVRQLKTTDTEIYYFFHDLEPDKAFSDYIVKEVKVTPPDGEELVVSSDGVVSNYESVTPIEGGGTITIGGTPVGGNYGEYPYTVTYETGEITGRNENIRVDSAVNSRPGLQLFKTDLSGNRLSGAVFTLKDSSGENVALPRYTSDSDGLITTAYLEPGEYTLTEIEVPEGFVILDDPITLIISDTDPKVTVEGLNAEFYSIDTDVPNMIAAIHFKNRPTGLQIIKTDALTGEPLEGVHFALYPQVTDSEGNRVKDHLPMRGYENIVSDENGILAEISMDLPHNTYYLEETQAAEGYIPIPEDLCFTIADDGTVKINTPAYVNWLDRIEMSDGSVSYVITMPNSLMGFELPATGGIGTAIFYIIGSILVICGGIYFIARRRAVK